MVRHGGHGKGVPSALSEDPVDKGVKNKLKDSSLRPLECPSQARPFTDFSLMNFEAKNALCGINGT